MLRSNGHAKAVFLMTDININQYKDTVFVHKIKTVNASCAPICPSATQKNKNANDFIKNIGFFIRFVNILLYL